MRALAFCLVALGCAGASHEALAPGLYAIDCKKSARHCYREAQTVCPSGFEILDKSEKSGAVANTAGETAVVVPTYDGTMLVRCRAQ
jgi:hypothetical protein